MYARVPEGLVITARASCKAVPSTREWLPVAKLPPLLHVDERNARKQGQVEHEVPEDWGCLRCRVLGPEAAQYLRDLASFDLRELMFGNCALVPIEEFNLHVVRGGYTGEDGSEISIPLSQAVDVVQLLSKPPVHLTGLGACDSLRLEAGIRPYSQDLDEDTLPIEAALAWVFDSFFSRESERRIVDTGAGKNWCENRAFIGTECVRKHLKEGPPWMRVGMIVEGAPARRTFGPSSSCDSVAEGSKIFRRISARLGAVESGDVRGVTGSNVPTQANSRSTVSL
ncbi:Aminomethyltransferase folate-binding domain-containing protein [Trametes sanguinea]|nr:Aminomethyltransferase folate-binding domain-containing protein [Trametes sanguinea]